MPNNAPLRTPPPPQATTPPPLRRSTRFIDAENTGVRTLENGGMFCADYSARTGAPSSDDASKLLKLLSL